MSQQMRNGYGFDFPVPVGQSMLVSSITGTYTATIVAGPGKGTALATDSTGGGTYGPYSGGVVIRLQAGANSLIDYDIAVSPVLTYAGPLNAGYNSSGDVASAVDGGGNSYALGIFNIAASSYYGFALRASQGGFGSPLDQSGNLNDPAITTALFPAARLNSTAYSLGAYRSPAVLTGKLYKCTTAGTSAASEPAGFTSAAIGATITDGSAVWTVERGQWYTAASGYPHIATIASGLINTASGALQCPAIAWDMAAGDSLIIRIRQAWNGAATDSRTALSENPILGTRHSSTSRNGVSIIGTGTTFGDLKIGVSDGTTTVFSGHVAAGFARKPLDGNVRDTVFMVDGLLKRTYAWTDGVSYSQSEMFSGGEKTPHQMDVSTVTGSTRNANPFFVGCAPGNATTYDFGVMALDVLVLPGRSLPTNTQAIADFYYSRGSDALLPAGLMIA